MGLKLSMMRIRDFTVHLYGLRNENEKQTDGEPDSGNLYVRFAEGSGLTPAPTLLDFF